MFRGEKAKGRISNDVTFQAAPPPTGGGPLKQVEERRCNDAPINALAAKLPNQTRWNMVQGYEQEELLLRNCLLDTAYQSKEF